MEPNRRFLVLVILGVLSGLPVCAQSAAVRMKPDPFYAELAARPSPLTPGQLIQASLVSSGAAPEVIAADTRKLEAIVAEVQQAVGPIRDPYARGNAVLAFMFKNLLTSYSFPQARMDILLSSGSFNCVSSAVLYMILARAVGLTVEAVSTPDHAFCTVIIGGKSIDVETTNPYGFDPGTKRDFRNAFGETGFVYIPPGDYALRKNTDGRGLLSFILQDRIALLERQASFGEAVGLAADRYALLGTRTAYGDLENEIRNLGASLNNQGEYAQGLAVLKASASLYGRTSAMDHLAADLAHNQALKLSQAGEYGPAMSFIDSVAARGFLSTQEVAGLRSLVVERQLYATVTTRPFAEALAAVQASFRKAEISQATYRRYVVSLYGRRAQEVASSQGYLTAVGVIDEAVGLIGNDPELLNARSIYLQDYVATVHNRFAALFNSKSYSQARQVLEEGLKAVPGNPLLSRDLALLPGN